MLSARPVGEVGKISQPAVNLCLNSQDFTASTWLPVNSSSVIISPNAATAPDGSQTATYFIQSETDNFIRQEIDVEAGNQYTFSIYYRLVAENSNPSGHFSATLQIDGAAYGGNGFAEFDLQDEVVESSGGTVPLDDIQIQNIDDIWFRLIVTFTAATTDKVRVNFTNGDNFGFTNQDRWYSWGAQLQLGANATNYIKTASETNSSDVQIVPNQITFEKYPFSHARIGYDNILTSIQYTVISGNDFDGYSAYGAFGNFQSCLTNQTWERWGEQLIGATGSSTGGCDITFNDSQLIGYVAIAAHNFREIEKYRAVLVYITVYFTNGDIEIFTFSNTDANANKPLSEILFFELEDKSKAVDSIEIRYPVIDQIPTEIGVLFTGQLMIMERPIYAGHSPAQLSDDVVFTNSMSSNGNFIGRTIESQSYKTSYSWRHLTPDWYRSTFQPFVEYAKEKPFFIQWRPDLFPDEVIYCWTTKDIKPTNMGVGLGLMQVKIDVEGYNGV